MSSKSSQASKGKSAIPEQLQQLPHLAKESAEQIWLAGLGAFSKAQQEGGKVFNVLVQDGLALQKQAQAMAQEQFQTASSRFEDLTSKVSERAAEPLDKGGFQYTYETTIELDGVAKPACVAESLVRRYP